MTATRLRYTDRDWQKAADLVPDPAHRTRLHTRVAQALADERAAMVDRILEWANNNADTAGAAVARDLARTLATADHHRGSMTR